MLVGICLVGFIGSVLFGLKYVYDFDCDDECAMLNGKFFIAMLVGSVCGAVMFTGFGLTSLAVLPLSMMIWFVISLLVFLFF